MGLTEKPTNSDIVDINLDGVTRTRFRINGDPNSIIELNLSDLGFVGRLEKGTKQLQDAIFEVTSAPDDDNLSDKLSEIDAHMREYVDYIFDYPVSAVCARYGTMFDPKNGKYRYETILDGLVKLYADNIREEYAKIKNRMKKHTAKYTGSSNKRKK